MSELYNWINKKRYKQFKISICYNELKFEFIIKHKTIMAGVIASLFFALVSTFYGIFK